MPTSDESAFADRRIGRGYVRLRLEEPQETGFSSFDVPLLVQCNPLQQKQIRLSRTVLLSGLADRHRLGEAALRFEEHRQVPPALRLARIELDDRPESRLGCRQIVAL